MKTFRVVVKEMLLCMVIAISFHLLNQLFSGNWKQAGIAFIALVVDAFLLLRYGGEEVCK